MDSKIIKYELLTNDKDGLNWIKIGDTNLNSKYITTCKE